MTFSARIPDDDTLRHPDTGRVLLTVLAQGRYAARLACLLIIAAIALLTASVWHGKPGVDWPAAWRNAPSAMLWLSLLSGMAQCCYALRVRLDSSLFAQLYARGAVDDCELRRLDKGLALLRSGKNYASNDAASKAPRGLQARWIGALRLLRRQLACCALQAICLLAAGALAWVC